MKSESIKCAKIQNDAMDNKILYQRTQTSTLKTATRKDE